MKESRDPLSGKRAFVLGERMDLVFIRVIAMWCWMFGLFQWLSVAERMASDGIHLAVILAFLGVLALIAGVGLWRLQKWGVVLYILYRGLVFIIDWVYEGLALPDPSVHSGGRVVFDLVVVIMSTVLIWLIIQVREASQEE